MKPITLPLAELKPALSGLGKVISRHTAVPALSSIKIERTQDGWIGLTATDQDRFITVRLEQPAEGEPLSLLIPLEELQKVAKLCGKDENIFVEPSGQDTAVIKFKVGPQLGETKVTMPPMKEFPAIPKIDGDPIPLSDTLRASIHQALECASKDNMRAILQGAFLDVSKTSGHYVVATDGRHLYSSNSFSLPLAQSVIIPNHRFLDWKEFNNDGGWQLKVTGGKAPFVQIASRRWRFISRQIEGQYPNWSTVVMDSAQARTHLTFPEPAIEQVLQTIQRLPCPDTVNSGLGLEIKGCRLTLKARTADAEEWTRVEMPGVTCLGADVTVMLNRTFLTKALQFGLNQLELTDELSPVKFLNGGRQMTVMVLRPNGPSSTAPIRPGATSTSTRSSRCQPRTQSHAPEHRP